MHTAYVFHWQWISFWLEMDPPDAERVAVGSRDHSLASSLKVCMSRRNLISQSARPGVNPPSHFLNYQHSQVAHATQASFSSDAQLRSCHKCFFHYRQPPNLHQSVVIFERFAAANAKVLIFLHLVHGLSQLHRSTVAIDTLQYSCVVGSDYIFNTHEV